MTQPNTLDWQPNASRDVLLARQQCYQLIRQFFSARNVLEVDTPILGQAPVCDPNIQPFAVPVGNNETRFLHTSPEYAMKRLLCAGVGDIFQLCKVFRQGESGGRHNPEFSMLEWYRVGFDHHQLMAEVAELVNAVLDTAYPVAYLTFQEAFSQATGMDPFHASDMELQVYGESMVGRTLCLDRDGWLDIIMSHCVEPSLETSTLVFVHDYPASQAALANIRRTGESAVAERFELYLNGMELANGYHELTDANEQRQRFVRDSQTANTDLDERLLMAMQTGLPECAGVALGVDRLLMLKLGVRMDETLSFAWSNA